MYESTWHIVKKQMKSNSYRVSKLYGFSGEKLSKRFVDVHLLGLAFDVMAGNVRAAVPGEGSLGIKLFEAFFVRCDATVSPDSVALVVQSWTVAVVTIAGVVRAGIPVLLVDILRTLSRLPCADFRQIALVRRLPAHHTMRYQLCHQIIPLLIYRNLHPL